MSQKPPKTPKADRPRSVIAEKAYQNMYGEYDGLTPFSIKRLHFFLKEILKCENYQVTVDKEGMQILVRVLNSQGKSVRVKPKDTQMALLTRYIDAPTYTVKFEDGHEKSDSSS